jgi:uncharacterized protein (TIGR02246 family)
MILDNMLLRALPFALIGSALHAAPVNPDQAAINQTAAAFVDAFHKGDAKTLASFYMPNADYVDASGHIFEGRDVIEKLYTDFFALNKGYQLRLNINSRKFPSPGLAIEDGTSVVIAPDGTAPVQTRYTNVFSKVDGKWLLSSVREGNAVAPSNYELLRGLEWSIGEWIDAEASGSAGRITFVWAPGNNFIVSTRTEDFKDISMLRTTQWIGWDAAARQIRSWSFQADGGTDLSTWTQNGSAWNIKTESTLANGSKVSSTSVVTPVDADTITWQMKNQTVNGKEVPDTKAVKMKRVK